MGSDPPVGRRKPEEHTGRLAACRLIKPGEAVMRKPEKDMELVLDQGMALPRARPLETIARMEDDSSNDEELLVRVADGDRGAFEQLYGRYARIVLGLALRRLGDRGRAEDAVQETF